MTEHAQHPTGVKTSPGRHVIVIGSGIGGLLAARVLADHFEGVTVIDRDHFSEAPDHRGGVPQSRHAHGLLPLGLTIISELFPGIEDELRSDGATVARDTFPVRIVSPAGPLLMRPWSGEILMFSRVLLEWRLRQRLAAHPRLHFLPDTEALGLSTEVSDARPVGRVSGVRVRYRQGSGAGVLDTDLVVDASGRGSKAPQWLAALGYGEVTEEVVSSQLGYASRFYAKPEGFPSEWLGLIVNGRPPHNPRAGLVLAIENERWHVTVGGFAGAEPPTDEAGFRQWARDLPDPCLYEAIRVARPLTPIRGWRTPTNRLRRFERVAPWPAGFVVTGDAVCALNPIYGQGMTVSATDALVLQKCLTDHFGGTKAGFERTFQRRLAKNVAMPWLVASSEDTRWPGVELRGARLPLGTSLIQRYLDLVMRAAMHDLDLSEKYLNMILMTAHPKTLFAPGVLARVAGHALAGRTRTAPQRFALSPQGLAAARRLPSYDPRSDTGSQRDAVAPPIPGTPR
ncbi:MAG: 2-polyprenyl-6-methoxyphenol hydroxylase-like oxidoreductase [Actinomycetota bacterium]|nr:2-polyprenyl-6-methoxyphenol hydroxylase-like oxidoreductase [Actinomycetota bacterium]